MQGKGEEKQMVAAITHVWVCARMLYKLILRGGGIYKRRRNGSPSHFNLPKFMPCLGILAALCRTEEHCAAF